MEKPLRVLIVEDSEDDTLLLLRELKRGGFNPTHKRVVTAEDMSRELSNQSWDIVISDYIMPGFSGFDSLDLLKKIGIDLPFLIVSGQIGEDTAVKMMKAGAHDCIMKDSLFRLVPAVQRELSEAEVRRQHKKVEDDLKKSEAKYRTLMEHIPVITYIGSLDIPGSKLYISPQVERILGYSPSEFEKDPDLWGNRTHPDDRPWMMTVLKSIHEIDQPSILEYRMYSKTDRLVWFRDEATVVKDDAGNPHFLQGVMFDITERKNAEEALQKAYAELEGRIAERTAALRKMNESLKREIAERKKTEKALRDSEEKFKALADNAPDLILRLDRDLRYVYASPKARRIMGISADEWIGKISEELGIPGHICELWNKAFRKVFQTGKIETIEFSIRTARGWKIYQLRIAPEFTQEGLVGSVMGVARDITKLKKAEKILKRDKETFEKLVHKKSEELLKTEKKLVDAKRLSDLGSLAATVAHELRNPLSVIRTATYNIKRKRRSSLIDKHLANIDKNISESNQIINNLLFYAQIKMPNFENTNIMEILNESIVSVKERYNTQKVFLYRRFKSVKNMCIEADPLHLKEMCVNILNNAYDAIVTRGRGQIEIKAVLDGKDCIKIYFKDNGTGIKKKDLKYVFEPFFSTKSKGTGLGLTVCAQIINLHDGQIKIESKKGEGTTVIVILPIKQKAKNENASNHESSYPA